MKREGSAADLARAGGRSDRPRAGDRPRTEEFDAADQDDQDADDPRPRAIHHAMETAEVDVGRDRRVTAVSPISEMMAESMTREQPPAPRRDPAAPEPRPVENTRRVGDSNKVRAGKAAATPDEGVAPWRQRAAQHIDHARAALDAGDIITAVTAAEEALREADEAPAPGIVEVVEPARPLLTRVFTTYVGPPHGLPVLAPRAEQIVRQRLGERERVLLQRIDGRRTLEELFDGSGLGPTDALRMVARLIRFGAIRVV